MDSTTPLDLSQFEGHTKGPWKLIETDEGHEIRMASAISSPGCYTSHHLIEYEHGSFPDTGHPDWQVQEAFANARLIAAAPAMIDEIRRLRAERDSFRDQLATTCGQWKAERDAHRWRVAALEAEIASRAHLLGGRS